MEMDILSNVKIVIKALIISSPKEVTIDDLRNDFRLMEGKDIPFKQLGYDTVEDLLHALSDTVEVFGRGRTATIHAVASQKSEHIQKMVKEQKKPAKHRKGRIKKVNPISEKRHVNDENIEEGQAMQPEETQDIPFFKNVDYKCITRVLTVRNVPSMAKGQKTIEEIKGGTDYNITEEKFYESGKQLDTKCQIEYKTANAAHINISAPKINSITHPSSTPKAFAGQQEVKSPRNRHQHNERQITPNKLTSNLPPVNGAQGTNFVTKDLNKAVPKGAINDFLFYLDLPISATRFRGQLPPNMTFESVDVGSRLVIIITEIRSPYKFWFHMQHDTHHLDTLMDNLKEWYKKVNGNEMRVPIDCLTPGQVCAASFHNVWHRATIIGYPAKNKVTVFLVDYGTVCKVDADKIKYLDLYFCTLPAQALRGRLSYVKPRRPWWDIEANKFFASLVTETVIYAKISKVNARQHVFYMVACCNRGGNVVQINNVLIKERYARPLNVDCGIIPVVFLGLDYGLRARKYLQLYKLDYEKHSSMIRCVRNCHVLPYIPLNQLRYALAPSDYDKVLLGSHSLPYNCRWAIGVHTIVRIGPKDMA
uniref:HTH OST-type domain-containing protein n=1 Tax=Glossina austeni TaxID=7395 RepID=A0A1A9USZ6_GLOAU